MRWRRRFSMRAMLAVVAIVGASCAGWKALRQEELRASAPNSVAVVFRMECADRVAFVRACEMIPWLLPVPSAGQTDEPCYSPSRGSGWLRMERTYPPHYRVRMQTLCNDLDEKVRRKEFSQLCSVQVLQVQFVDEDGRVYSPARFNHQE